MHICAHSQINTMPSTAATKSSRLNFYFQVSYTELEEANNAELEPKRPITVDESFLQKLCIDSCKYPTHKLHTPSSSGLAYL
jgi:hypothetical protein